MNTNKLAGGAILLILLAALIVLVVIRISSPAETPELPPVSESIPPETVSPTVTDSPEPVPTPTLEATPKPTPESTPDPFADKPDIDIDDWKYVLANQDNLLDRSFAPELTGLENGHFFDSRAVDALRAFINGARDEGLSVYLTSSYRSYATQESLFNNKVAQYGGDRETAARIVAIPGSSEHQTGLAADIVDKYYQYMNESLADTALSKWMKAHCAEYGFILRFPENKQEITGIMFEPWHFRYVGEEAAAYIMEKGLCLEEFVALYREQ